MSSNNKPTTPDPKQEASPSGLKPDTKKSKEKLTSKSTEKLAETAPAESKLNTKKSKEKLASKSTEKLAEAPPAGSEPDEKKSKEKLASKSTEKLAEVQPLSKPDAKKSTEKLAVSSAESKPITKKSKEKLGLKAQPSTTTATASPIDYKKIITDQVNKPPENLKADQPRINLRKKTRKELEEMVTARETTEEDSGEDEYTLPHTCRSEYTLKELNNTLTVLPIVRAFNSAEGKIRSSSEGGKKQSKRGKKSTKR